MFTIFYRRICFSIYVQISFFGTDTAMTRHNTYSLLIVPISDSIRHVEVDDFFNHQPGFLF